MAKKATEKAVPKVETPPKPVKETPPVAPPEPVESEHDRLEREGLN
jgi:hypothetical protein